MKRGALIPVAALAFFASCAVAAAMTSVPYSGKVPAGPNGFAGGVNAPDTVNDPYASAYPSSPPPAAVRRDIRRSRTNPGSLNVDPFDPNSTVNSFDRQRYANPYPYDPIYNPYGQGASRYSPMGPNVPMGQGIPAQR